MKRKITVIVFLILFSITCQCQDYNACIKNKTWYAMKIIVGESGASDRDFSPYDQTPYLLTFKISSTGGLIVYDTRNNSSKFNGNNPEKITLQGRRFTIQYTVDLTEDFIILYADNHFLKLRSSNDIVYYFISDDYAWEKRSRDN